MKLAHAREELAKKHLDLADAALQQRVPERSDKGRGVPERSDKVPINISSFFAGSVKFWMYINPTDGAPRI